ncbi:class I SAM-dependent methyltransferase [Niveibacterium sp. SC-1]|uniref:class I SAM-dependent methyltransferase n=1 Tax=Niveibacterium sp. SC-1 TaxID=3135646 RepID=UPI00312049CF
MTLSLTSVLLSALLAGLALVVLLQLYTLRKLRRVDRHLWNLCNELPETRANEFRQIEALLALYADLKPQLGLPPTRGWAGSPDFLRTLAAHVIRESPETVVECSSGASTLILAHLLRRQGFGHAYSLEHETEYADKTRALLAAHGLSDWATVIDAPLQATRGAQGEQPWYALAGLPASTIDLLVIDGPPTHVAPLARYPAGPHLFPRLSARGHVFLDDAGRSEERETVRRWLAEMPQFEHVALEAEKGLAMLRPRLTAGHA